MKPVLVIHGGAGSRRLQGESYERYQQSLVRILEKVYPALERGGSALNAVAKAVELLEDDPLYNAGLGSKIQSDGKIRMSASIMDGWKRRFAGCVNVERVKNPVRLAQALLKEESRVLAERGGESFAKSLGLSFASPYTPERRREFNDHKKGKTGTVGAIALDKNGRLAAATSTGGRGFEYPHRVSDTPTVAGNYANRLCAVSATGTGEEIVDFSAASNLCAMVEAGLPLDKSARQLVNAARRAKASFGFIALDKRGRFVALTTTECLIWGSASREGIEVF